MWAGEAAMRKSIPALRQAGYESISDLPRIQQSLQRESISGDTIGDEEMCNDERRAKSSGVDSSNRGPRLSSNPWNAQSSWALDPEDFSESIFQVWCQSGLRASWLIDVAFITS